MHKLYLSTEDEPCARRNVPSAGTEKIERRSASVSGLSGLWQIRHLARPPNIRWLVEVRGIEPHIPVFDKSGRKDDTFERSAFVYDQEDDSYICPGGKRLRSTNRNFKTPRPLANADGFIRYRASQKDCQACQLRQRCTPKMAARKIMRSVHEGARDMARAIATTDAYLVSRRQRKKVEMLFAHLKRILKLDRLRLRGPHGAKDEFHLARPQPADPIKCHEHAENADSRRQSHQFRKTAAALDVLENRIGRKADIGCDCCECPEVRRLLASRF